jgi:peroxiredoxin
MTSRENSIQASGRRAPDFALRGTDGRTHTLADVRGPKGTLIVFICNHCPYFKASIDRIVSEASALRDIGIGTIAIMPNDTATYREDSFDNMKAFAATHRCHLNACRPVAHRRSARTSENPVRLCDPLDEEDVRHDEFRGRF